MNAIEELESEADAGYDLPPIIIHHGGCPDGFTAAMILNFCLGGGCELVRGHYGEDPPEVTNRHVWIVDFSYPHDTLEQIWVVAASVSMLDHHDTAVRDIDFANAHSLEDAVRLAGSDENFIWLDTNQSGAGMVARFCEEAFLVGDESQPFVAPDWVWNVEDRDLWRFDLEHTEDVLGFLTSHPYDYDTWVEFLLVDRAEMARRGAEITRYRNQLISAAVATAYRAVLPTGHEVWVACCPYAIGSDVAGRLAETSDEGWAAYYVNYGHKVRYGLRSRAPDIVVNTIAESLGGGGHPQSAGFESDLLPSPA